MECLIKININTTHCPDEEDVLKYMLQQGFSKFENEMNFFNPILDTILHW